MKILLISNALGQPNYGRGSGHSTCELVRSLAAEGHHLTLLVETTHRYRRLRRRQNRSPLFMNHSRAIELLVLYRSLDESTASEATRQSTLRRTVGRAWDLGSSLLQAIGLFGVRAKLIDNQTGALEYVPTCLRHLTLFGDFLLKAGLYSYHDTSALLRLPAPRIDARGYDIILVDTPMRVVIKRDRDARVVCLVHDLLPLTDPGLSDVATRTFLSRLSTSLRQSDELTFLSNCSMIRFRDALPEFARMPARVVYPRTRFKNRDFSQLTAPSDLSAQSTFVVIVSAESRKNLSAVIRAFRKLPQANLVVIDQTDLDGSIPNLPLNVRFAGYVGDEEKASLIAKAAGLIVPSFAEGFGVPIIEAFAADTPELCSDIPVFREIAGELADYFDPFSTESLCAAVIRALSRQEEQRRKIWEQHDELAQRFGCQTQARDFIAQHVLAAPKRSIASADLNDLAPHDT